ncbi:MAG TPA: pirin family protein [Acidimicrobiales bacterium]|nr:pirin family protein [Acidimicrobiales bacterium]
MSDSEAPLPDVPGIVLTDSRSTYVGQASVRRALPTRGRRTVGAWCFVDHIGPASFSPENRFDVAPHPHIGLQTVTWLFDGAIVHRDSLGSEQLIRSGQLNLMTSGEGIAHSEENPGITSGELHGVQLWVALPNATRHGGSEFEHYEALPTFGMAHGSGSVLIGQHLDQISPARRDSDLVGLELRLLPGDSTVELRPDFEYALVVTNGALELDGTVVEPGHLAYLRRGRDAITLRVGDDTTALLLGGVPFEETVMMWWNFVARTQDEISDAYESWLKHDERFGAVSSTLPRIEVGPPPWHLRR